MGLLDELRREANEIRVSDARTTANGNASVAQAHSQLLPCMEALHAYFKELIEHLNVISPDINTACEVDAFGSVEALKHSEYRFWTERPDDPSQFTFGFTLSSNERPQVRLPHAVADKTLTRLKGMGIPCVATQVGAGHTTLVLTPKIPVLFEFGMDVEQAVVRLQLRNHERLGVLRYNYKMDAISDELMEELASLILAKPNRFKALSGGTVAGESRQAIQRSLEREQRRRKAELGGPVAKASWAVGEVVRRVFRKT